MVDVLLVVRTVLEAGAAAVQSTADALRYLCGRTSARDAGVGRWIRSINPAAPPLAPTHLGTAASILARLRASLGDNSLQVRIIYIRAASESRDAKSSSLETCDF